jgi:hypothetical protein
VDVTNTSHMLVLCLLAYGMHTAQSKAFHAFGRHEGAEAPLKEMADNADRRVESVPRPFSASDDEKFLPILAKGSVLGWQDFNGNVRHPLLTLPCNLLYNSVNTTLTCTARKDRLRV